MSRTVVILATLDTKGEEAAYLRRQVESLGGEATIMDLGVVGEPAIEAEHGREAVAAAGGVELSKLLEEPTRETAGPVMVSGATKIVLDLIAEGRAHAVLGVGGTQGTTSCTRVMQALPYGFPKLVVSTVASGDTAPFVGIKDITMMFSVSDLLGVNRLSARILGNAAAAAYGMSLVGGAVETGAGDRPLIAMTNLGVLTEGAELALELFREAGYEVVVFHAVGSGGRAMEQLMREGVIGAVFDYALGEIADDVFGGLRAGGPERLTVAGELGIPQVIVPGGAEHLGLFVDAHTVPEAWADHAHVFHSPVIFVPRLRAEEMARVAEEICGRLASTTGGAAMLLPLRGVGRYSIPGGPLHDPEADAVFFEALREGAPAGISVIDMDCGAEDPAFVRAAVETLLGLLDGASSR